jgi:hypothetical protein
MAEGETVKHRWMALGCGLAMTLGMATACSSTSTSSTATTTASSAPSTAAGSTSSPPGSTKASSGGQPTSTMNQGQFEQFASAMLGTTPEQATCLFDAAKTNPGLALMFTEGKPASEKPTLEQAKQIISGFNGCTGSQAATAKLLGPLLSISLPASAATCMTGVMAQLSADDFAYLLAEMPASISPEGTSQIATCTGTTTTAAP